MHPVATLLQLVVLFGTTLAIIFIDRAVRKNKPVPQDNFFQTRNKPLWGFIGFLAFCFCFGASVVVGIIVNLLSAITG
jgi:hypothetical protein